MKTIGVMLELKISVSDEVAKQISEEIENAKEFSLSSAEFSLHPAFPREHPLTLERVDANGVIVGTEPATISSVEFVDYDV